jgi:putative transposase
MQKYGIKYQEVDEAYTTKICSNCGQQNFVGVSKIYRCSNSDCSYTADRDMNAAKNIMLRGLR